MKYPSGSYLVIGASGLIGRHLHSYLLQRKPEARLLGTYCSRYEPGLVPFDLSQSPWPEGDLEGPGVLFLCSAMTRLGEVFANPVRARDVNVENTRRIILEGRKRGFRPVFFSSGKVYGTGPGPFKENRAGDPQTLYGQLKWEVETWLGQAIPEALVVRLSKVYGTEGDECLIGQMTRSLKAGKEVVCCPDLLIQPTHLDDVARGIMDLVDTESSGAWNLAHPQVWSRLELGLALCRRLGCAENLIRSLPVAELHLQEPYPPDARLDVSKFFGQVPRPFLSLDDGLARLRP